MLVDEKHHNVEPPFQSQHKDDCIRKANDWMAEGKAQQIDTYSRDGAWQGTRAKVLATPPR
jgi:hypothetical protein